MKTKNLSEQAYTHILDRVLQNQLKPGDWVDRREIAEQLNLSLMPISDAIQRLTAEGFLVTVPRRGTQVRVPSREDIRGQLLLREALECQCARLYCGAPVAACLTQLEELAGQADELDNDSAVAWRNDLAFHQALVELSDCVVLQHTFDRVMNLALFQHTAILTPYPFNRGDSHVNLLKDIVEMESDQAEARIRHHIRTGKEEFFRKSARSI